MEGRLTAGSPVQIPLPSNTKVHYKFIVDGNWTTSPDSPIVNDAGNQNNVVDVGPAPSAAEAVSTKATEVGAGVVAGVTGAAAAAGVAATKFTDQVNGGTNPSAVKEQPKELTEAEKKADPAAEVRKAADSDIRSECALLMPWMVSPSTHTLLTPLHSDHVPTSLTTATHAAAPVLASAVATVTGADILRGNPEALPVTDKERADTQAQAMKGDNAYLASRLEPQGGAISDPREATTENAKAAAAVASSATVGAPAVPVTNNGFAANVTAGSGGLSTAADSGKEGSDKAGAVAAASAGAVGAGGVVAGGAGALAASKRQESVGNDTTAEQDKKLPTVRDASSKEAADKAAAPAAASTGPLATGKETTTPAVLTPTAGSNGKQSADKAGAGAAVPASAVTPEKSLPGTPTKKKEETTSAAKATPTKATPNKSTPTKSTPGKTDTVKGSRFSTVPGRRKESTDLNTAVKDSAAPEAQSGTPERKRKQSLFGKIKSALSPNSSPSK